MDEWMNGWMDEWMNGGMDEWMNEWVDNQNDHWVCNIWELQLIASIANRAGILFGLYHKNDKFVHPGRQTFTDISEKSNANFD